jgi:methylenetetrahydrofolate dehydrogenase (NADP+)/methenyltetrahydrofolate cyclohydrolase
MKELNGSELAGFIKERQAKEVRRLKQSLGVQPKLAIVYTLEHGPSLTYMGMKRRYGADIGVEADIHFVEQAKVRELLEELNADTSVHGIIVQLPLADASETDAVVNMIAPEKDVDGLGETAPYTPATPMAILWLLAGYNVNLEKSRIALVGRGKLVGAPLIDIFTKSGYDFVLIHSQTPNTKELLLEADVIITATGRAGLITSDMVKPGAVVCDAGVAGEKGKTVGDVADDVYERDDITLTPRKGGVGPLTICALFENTIRAAEATAEASAR